MTQFLELDGQKVAYNPDTKIVKTTIKEPFYKASKILGWNKQSPGLGLNEKIIQLVVKTKSHLIVHVESSCHDYSIPWDKVSHILKTENTQYRVTGDNWLSVLPWREFGGYHHPQVQV